jgi:carbon storage regulator
MVPENAAGLVLGLRFSCHERANSLERTHITPGQEAIMLVLTRKPGESICVGSNLEIVVLDTGRGRVKLGFRASREVSIRRGELANPDKSLQEAVSGATPQPSVRHDPPRMVPPGAPLRGFRPLAELTH